MNIRTQDRQVSINVTSIQLDYPVGALVRSSIKSEIFSLFGAKDRAPNVEFVRALNNISFSISSGERVGVIGKNGSGKSTLLRAIAGIYPITSGVIEVHGRIQGMFDITLGFEPEATGRENIMYRGLVVGLSPAEVRAKEAEIVEFAAIGSFVDLPVRTYSTGMAVRLAFAISTYMRGDILLLDEMLSAGDAGFVAKAQGRMKSLVDSARIVVLVSHDMAAIRNVCPRTIWLDQARIVMDGTTDEVVEAYLNWSVQAA